MLKQRPGIPKDASGYWSWPGCCCCWQWGPGDAAPTAATQEVESQLAQISFSRTTNKKRKEICTENIILHPFWENKTERKR